MNKILKSLSILIVSLLFTITVDAASANVKVTTNKSQVVVGNTFTVTTKISGSDLGSWQWTLSYDTKKFKLVSGGNVFFFSESGENQKIFGSITSKEIAENLKEQYKIEIDKKKIDLKEPIKVLGVRTVSIKLFEGVVATLKVQVL